MFQIELNYKELEEIILLSKKIVELNESFQESYEDFVTCPEEQQEQIKLEIYCKLNELTLANEWLRKKVIIK